MLFSRTTPLPQLGLWTFEPAFSPRVSFPLSPRSIFQTSQRFLLLNHVTSGSMSLRSLFHTWSAVSPTGNDMTSSSGHVIALDQSEARKVPQMGPLYYSSTILYSCHFVVYLCQNNFFCASVIFAVSSDLLYASNKSLFHT